MTAARVASVRFMTILSKSAWEETVRKLCFRLLQFAVPVIKFVVIELVPLRGGMNLGHAHKTRFRYLLDVLSKFSDKHLRPFYRRVPPPPQVEAYRLIK